MFSQLVDGYRQTNNVAEIKVRGYQIDLHEAYELNTGCTYKNLARLHFVIITSVMEYRTICSESVKNCTMYKSSRRNCHL